jgi:hypothetical protein
MELGLQGTLLSMRFTKLEEKQTCPAHGDGVFVLVEPGLSAPPASSFKVCYRCLDEAIAAYQGAIVCERCGVPVKAGYGIERNGQMHSYCAACQTDLLFGLTVRSGK